MPAINAADYAQMNVTTAGSGPVVQLSEKAGRPKFRDRWPTGTHPILYQMTADNGMRERAVGTYDADADEVTRPDVTLSSWAPGVGYTNQRVNLPSSGVTIGFAVGVTEFNAINAEIVALQQALEAALTQIESKAPLAHGHVIADVAGLQAALDTLAGGPPGGGGGLTDGVRGDIDVQSGASILRVVAGAIDTAKMGGDVTPTGKQMLTLENISALQALLNLASAAFIDAGSFAPISHAHSAGDLTSGTVAAARMPPQSGDVTSPAGSTATTIANGAVTTAKMGGDVTAAGKALLTAADAGAQRTALGLGTAATQSQSAFAPAAHAHSAGDLTSGTLAGARMPALTGDVTMAAGSTVTVIPNASIAAGKLGVDITAAGKALLTAADAPAQRTALGLGTAATSAATAFAPAAHTHNASDINAGTLGAARMPGLSGDVTSAVGSTATTIAAGAVNTAKMGGDVTAAGKALLTAANPAAQRAALELNQEGGEVNIPIADEYTEITPFNGIFSFKISPRTSGHTITDADAYVLVPHASAATTLRVRRKRGASIVTVADITIPATAEDSFGAVQPITTANADLLTGDVIILDVISIGTGVMGLGLILDLTKAA